MVELSLSTEGGGREGGREGGRGEEERGREGGREGGREKGRREEGGGREGGRDGEGWIKIPDFTKIVIQSSYFLLKAAIPSSFTCTSCPQRL